MKKFYAFLFLFGTIAFVQPTSAQVNSLTDVPVTNPVYNTSNYFVFLQGAGQYLKLQNAQATIMKIGSLTTLGGYTLFCQKTTDLTSGKSASAVYVRPNGNTTGGGFLKKATGNLIGGANQEYYIDIDEVPTILATAEKMQKALETTPTVNTTFTYICRGGFMFNCGYVAAADKALQLGQLGETGDMPLKEFLTEVIRAFKEVQTKFGEIK